MTIRREGDELAVEFPSGNRREHHGTGRLLISDGGDADCDG
jgi:hypothetical protein